MPLKGGPARGRKRKKRMPTTALGIRNARLAFGYKSFGKEMADKLAASWRGTTQHTYDVTAHGRTIKYKYKILAKPIYKGKKGRCVYFVTKTEGLPRTEDKPYEMTSLCNGGRVWTGHTSWRTKRDAAASAKRAAAGDTGGRR
jgi:hypothetical protein